VRLAVDFGEVPAVVRVPETFDLRVAATGETQHAKETNACKEAQLENGMIIPVPLCMRAGEVGRIGMEAGRYVQRVKEKKG